MNEALKISGLANSWTMPIKGRIEMLSTGLKTPLGLKISGSDLDTIEEIGARVESVLTPVKGTRSVFAERTGSGYFLDFEWDREALSRYGLSVEEAQGVVQRAIGGENVTTTVEGRERYAVNVRYQRDFRGDLGALGRVLVPVAGGQKQIPVSQLARISVTEGPSMIRDEDGLLTGYVYLDIAGRDQESYIAEAGRLLTGKGEAAAGVRHLLERPVRGHAAGQGKADLGRSPDPVFDPVSTVPQHPVPDQDPDHHAGRAVFGHRGLLVPLPARL